MNATISVFVAFAVSWLMVAAWVARIGAKVDRLAERVGEEP